MSLTSDSRSTRTSNAASTRSTSAAACAISGQRYVSSIRGERSVLERMFDKQGPNATTIVAVVNLHEEDSDMRLLILPLVAVALVAAACGNDDSGGGGEPGLGGSPEEATKALFELVDRQQWGREWESLHPEQQKFIPRERYVSCAESAGMPGIDSVEILEVYDEPAEIPGTGITAESKAVTVEMKVSQGLLKNESRDTIHLFEVDGRWRWVLSNAEAFRDGECPP